MHVGAAQASSHRRDSAVQQGRRHDDAAGALVKRREHRRLGEHPAVPAILRPSRFAHAGDGEEDAHGAGVRNVAAEARRGGAGDGEPRASHMRLVRDAGVALDVAGRHRYRGQAPSRRARDDGRPDRRRHRRVGPDRFVENRELVQIGLTSASVTLERDVRDVSRGIVSVFPSSRNPRCLYIIT